MTDRLHQPARAKLMPWLDFLIGKACEAGAAGAALSGAGTTVLALCAAGRAHDVANAFREAARAQNLGGRAEVLDVGVPGARAMPSG
jgi:homoserine kinase